jgi:hypothetical protein
MGNLICPAAATNTLTLSDKIAPSCLLVIASNRPFYKGFRIAASVMARTLQTPRHGLPVFVIQGFTRMQKSNSQSRELTQAVQPVSNKRTSAASLVAVALILSATANAQAPKPEPMPTPQPPVMQSPAPSPSQSAEALFRRIDTDADGTISKAELEKFDADAAKQFEKFDVDKDGKLTMVEFDAMLKGIRG